MLSYLVNVDYERQIGEDNPGKVKESYLVIAAHTPSDAERVVLAKIKPFMFGDNCTVLKIQKVNFFDVRKHEGKEFWYKAKVEMIIVDGLEETRKAVSVLIQGDTVMGATVDLNDDMGDFDHELVSIQKTPIVGIL